MNTKSEGMNTKRILTENRFYGIIKIAILRHCDSERLILFYRGISMEKIKKKIIIVEDDNIALSILREHLDRYSRETELDFDITHFSDGIQLLEQYPTDVDIIFMDIDLPELNGMEVVRKLRQKDSDVVVIFVTNLAQYAVEGYSVDALDFIVKPVTYYNFQMKFKRALTRSVKRKNVTFWIDLKGGGKQEINTNELKYIEITQHLLAFHTTHGIFESWGALNSMKERLKNAPFELCNRCYLVNLKFVKGISQYDLSLGDEVLQISHTRRATFMLALNRYLSGEKNYD